MTSSTRSDRVTARLEQDFPRPHFVLRETCSDEWLSRFPGGFSPIPLAMAGPAVFEFCPGRIAEHAADLSDAQLDEFCAAIQVWQLQTVGDYMMRLPGDLVVAKFLQDHPREGETLVFMAYKADIPLIQFVGATRGGTTP